MNLLIKLTAQRLSELRRHFLFFFLLLKIKLFFRGYGIQWVSLPLPVRHQVPSPSLEMERTLGISQDLAISSRKGALVLTKTLLALLLTLAVLEHWGTIMLT